MDYRDRTTIEPGKRSGKPCLRGLRITVSDVLEYLASGVTEDEILAAFLKDNDFQQMSFVFGAPPKVIWIRPGNCSVAEIEEILRANASRILEFEKDEESSCLVLQV